MSVGELRPTPYIGTNYSIHFAGEYSFPTTNAEPINAWVSHVVAASSIQVPTPLELWSLEEVLWSGTRSLVITLAFLGFGSYLGLRKSTPSATSRPTRPRTVLRAISVTSLVLLVPSFLLVNTITVDGYSYELTRLLLLPLLLASWVGSILIAILSDASKKGPRSGQSLGFRHGFWCCI